MTKARSFRLTTESERKLSWVQGKLGLDNPNMTLNRIIEDYNSYLKAKDIIEALDDLLKKIKERGESGL